MAKTTIDLHTHTIHSDGTDMPAQLIRKAMLQGIRTISITDHDETDGIAEGKREAERHRIRVIDGIEFGIAGTTEIHLLAYFVNVEDNKLQNILEEKRKRREKRTKIRIDKLNELGYKITFEDVKKRTVGSIAAPHIVNELLAHDENRRKLEENGVKLDLHSIIGSLFGFGKPLYLPTEDGPTTKETIDLIHSAGGLSFIAHPIYNRGDEGLIDKVIKEGIDGIEVYHGDHTQEQIDKYLKIAKDNNLLVSGGSDYHGGNKNVPLGTGREEIGYPEEYFAEILKTIKR